MLRQIYKIYVREAPDPSEIKWHNMDFYEHFKIQYYVI